MSQPPDNVENIADRVPREHGGSLCVLDHWCPECKLGVLSFCPYPGGMFNHPECGMVCCEGWTG